MNTRPNPVSTSRRGRIASASVDGRTLLSSLKSAIKVNTATPKVCRSETNLLSRPMRSLSRVRATFQAPVAASEIAKLRKMFTGTRSSPPKMSALPLVQM